MPSFRILDCSVERFIPNRAAAQFDVGGGEGVLAQASDAQNSEFAPARDERNVAARSDARFVRTSGEFGRELFQIKPLDEDRLA